MFADLQVLFLGADILIAGGSVLLVKGLFPQYDSIGSEIGVGFILGLGFNELLMQGSLNMMAAHAALGTLVGWYIWHQLLKLYVWVAGILYSI